MEEKLIFRQRVIKILTKLMIIFVAEALVLYLFWNYIGKKAEEVKQQKALLFAFEEEKLHFDTMEQDYEKVKPYIPSLKNALPNDENLYRIVEGMENTALKNGSRITIGIDNQSIVPSGIGGVNYVLFNGGFDGGYSALRKYLGAVADSPIFAQIDSISLTSSNLINEGGTATFKGKIYTK